MHAQPCGFKSATRFRYIRSDCAAIHCMPGFPRPFSDVCRALSMEFDFTVAVGELAAYGMADVTDRAIFSHRWGKIMHVN